VAPAEQPAIPRRRSERDLRDFVPVHVVWELTLACNLKCSHCGSRAGKRRPDELTTAEALEVVEQLARLGTRELTIIGGEAYLRRDWTQIVAAAAARGIYCAMQTGARALTENRLRAGIAAGARRPRRVDRRARAVA
jgi:MoaA/NifB/PqqE/SkfB family radical SAM enzyme